MSEKPCIGKRGKLWVFYNMDCFFAPCMLCGKIITPFSFEAGHVISKANGGTTDTSNMRVICRECNSSMGCKDMRDFMLDNEYKKSWNWDGYVVGKEKQKQPLSPEVTRYLKLVELSSYSIDSTTTTPVTIQYTPTVIEYKSWKLATLTAILRTTTKANPHFCMKELRTKELKTIIAETGSKGVTPEINLNCVIRELVKEGALLRGQKKGTFMVHPTVTARL